MAGRPCKICSSSEKTRIAAEMVAAGETDTAVAARLGISRPAVHRHRVGHLQPLARAVADAAGKGMPARKEREKALAAAEKGELDPATFLSMGSLTAELRKAADRIERASSEAEKAGQLTALAQLLGQAHKNVETRAKLSGIGNFGSTKVAVGIGIGVARAFEPFVLKLNIGDRPETMVFAPEGTPAFEVRDAETGMPFDPHSKETRDLLFVPKGHPTAAPVIDHEPGDGPGIEQASTVVPAPDEDDQDDGADIDKILNSIFDKPPDAGEEVEPAPIPKSVRAGRLPRGQ